MFACDRWYIALPHWSTIPQKILHPVTCTFYNIDTSPSSFILMLNDNVVQILLPLVWCDRGSNQQSATYKTKTLTTKPPQQLKTRERPHFPSKLEKRIFFGFFWSTINCIHRGLMPLSTSKVPGPISSGREIEKSQVLVLSGSAAGLFTLTAEVGDAPPTWRWG